MDLFEQWLYNYLISARSTPSCTDQSEWTCLNSDCKTTWYPPDPHQAVQTNQNGYPPDLHQAVQTNQNGLVWTVIVKLPDIPQIHTKLYRAIRMDLNSMKSLKASSAASFTLVRLFLSHWTSRNQSRYFWWSEIMQQTFKNSRQIDIQIKYSWVVSGGST